MAYSKNDNDSQRKDLKGNGWKKSAYDDNTWLKGNHQAKQSESEGSWTVNGTKYTNYSDAKKSGRL